MLRQVFLTLIVLSLLSNRILHVFQTKIGGISVDVSGMNRILEIHGTVLASSLCSKALKCNHLCQRKTGTLLLRPVPNG